MSNVRSNLLIIVLLLFFVPASAGGEDLEDLNLPEGFTITRFDSDLEGPRFMAFDPDGVLYVTLMKAGKVVALPDRDGDGSADRAITVTKGLNNPHGIAFFKGYLYVAETQRIVRFRLQEDSLKVGSPETVVSDLPTQGGGHFTRTVVFSTDGQMYVSVGSSCNICKEKERERASVLNFLSDGSDKAYYAEGLRNTVGLAFHPVTGLLYGTENGRDELGDDLPPDELNLIELGGHYGWPYCWGDKIPDTVYNKKRFCKITSPPVVKFQAHSAPLGLAFGTSESFPPKYQGGLFVAFHGSWNRSVPTGYKVVYVPFRDNRPMDFYVDFVSGWLKDGKKWGRPVDVAFGPDGAMYISDDFAGTIYRVTYDKD